MRLRNLLPTFMLAPALLAVTPAPARAGQTDETLTRAAALVAEREAKRSVTTPPERSFLERKLYWYDNQHVLDKVFGGWHGIHLAGGDFPAGAGTKFGVGFDATLGPSAPARANRIDVSARAARSTSGYTRLAGTVGLRQVGGAPIDVSGSVQKYEFPQEDFFGFGSESLDANRTNYLMKGADAGADVLWTPLAMLTFGAGMWRVSPETGAGTDSLFPSVEQVFDTSELPAFGIQTHFLRSDASATFDWRDNPLHPHAGGRYVVRFASFQDQDTDAFDFQRVELEVQQYVPLPHKARTLALRAAAVFTEPGQDGGVPFFYQPTLGGSQALRGFREFRFRDRHSLLLSAEYRWEAWWALDGALFVDVGEVASSRRGFTLKAMEASYGIGFRIHSNRAFISRLDLAFSREGFIPLLRFEHAF